MVNQAKKKITLPSNVSFRRSVDNSEGLMYSVLEKEGKEDFEPVYVEQLTLRGAMAAYNSGYKKGGHPLDGEELEKAQNPASPNIQAIDRANLSAQTNKLSLKFSVAFHGSSLSPDACSVPEYSRAVQAFCEKAAEAGMYRDLASRYFWNLVNGRVLWRNGTTGIPLTAQVSTSNGEDKLSTLLIDWKDILLDHFPGVDAIANKLIQGKEADLNSIINRIADALSGKQRLLALDIDIRVQLYNGAEVWPSQEFVQESQKKRNGEEISRILSSRPLKDNKRHATMHSQKIGNAIRTIDEWHGNHNYGATPVEAFGWFQKDLIALREPNANADAYAAFSDIADTTLHLGEEAYHNKALYTLAMLIRGGVYGIGKDDEADAKKDKKGKKAAGEEATEEAE